MLCVKLNDKENELQETLQNLQEARRNCSQLHEAASMVPILIQVNIHARTDSKIVVLLAFS